MTGIYINSDGVWNRIKHPMVNVDGVWLVCKNVWINANGKWHKVWQFEAEIITLPVNFKTRQEIHDVCACAA